MAHKLGKKLLSWDESIDDEVRFRFDQQEEELKEGLIFANEWKTETEIEEEIYTDQDFWQIFWEDLTECLTTILKRKNPDGYWKAQVRNFGWRNLDGVKFLQAGDGESFLREILPKTDCHYYIFNYGKGLAIQNFHHDSPVGNEWYYVVRTAGETNGDLLLPSPAMLPLSGDIPTTGKLPLTTTPPSGQK